MTLVGLLTIILTLALIGFIVYLIITYIPMPDIFRKVIIVIIAVVVILWLIGYVNGGGIELPRLK